MLTNVYKHVYKHVYKCLRACYAKVCTLEVWGPGACAQYNTKGGSATPRANGPTICYICYIFTYVVTCSYLFAYFVIYVCLSRS